MNLAWKEIKYSKKNYILVEVTLILLMFMVIFLSGLTHGLDKAASSALNNIPAKNFIVNSDSEGALASSNITNEQMLKLKEELGEDVSELLIHRSYITTVDSDTKVDIAYFGINMEENLNPEISEGEKLGLEKNTIVLDSKFKTENINLGDSIIDSASGEKLKVVGFISDNSYSYTGVGYVSLETLTDLKNKVNNNYKGSYTTLVTNKDIKDAFKSEDMLVKTKEEIINKLPGYEAQQGTIIMITWVLVIISAAILGVFFYIITIQKKQTYGVMKALGMRNLEITKILVTQILILAIIGVIIANIIAYGAALMLPPTLPYFVKYGELAIIIFAFIIISILSGLISIAKIAKVDPLITIGGK